ncbi:MAG: hypothetical protein ACOX1F_00925 [Erysipelotrichaceae bacterium]|jgi:hypothetical protein
MSDILKEMEPMFELPRKMKLQQEATEAINWIADELDKIKGDSMYQWQKSDNIAKVREAISKLI